MATSFKGSKIWPDNHCNPSLDCLQQVRLQFMVVTEDFHVLQLIRGSCVAAVSRLLLSVIKTGAYRPASSLGTVHSTTCFLSSCVGFWTISSVESDWTDGWRKLSSFCLTPLCLFFLIASTSFICQWLACFAAVLDFNFSWIVRINLT